MQIAEATDHVLGTAEVEQPSANFIRTRLDFVEHHGERNAVGKQLVGIELHLILPDEPADTGDLGDSWHGLKRIAQMPVLQAAQVGEAAFPAFIYNGVLIHPAGAGGVGADGRVYVLRKTPANLLQVFDNSRTRPVEVSTVLEDDIDIGIPEHRLRSHSFYMGCSQEAGH